MKIIDSSTHLSLNLELSPIGFDLLPTSLHDNRTLSLNLQPELRKGVCWKEFGKGSGLSQLAIALKVARVLMHGNVYDTIENGKDLVIGLKALLELQVFIPKWVCKEV